jgi:UDP-N-acetylmuramoyl-tripeptide--D-alanyl-D-alanine ligase
MIFEMNNSYEFAVLEMGANKEHEIEHLVEIASPDIVVINNAALAHLDGFMNIDGVAKAKGEILQGSKSPNFAILNRDDNYFDLWSNMGKQSEIISFGSDSKAMVYPKNIILEKNQCTFDLNCPHGLETINLNLPGMHNIINACAASAVMYSLSKDISEIKEGLESVAPVTGRLEFISLTSGHEIINDTYNANPKSTLAAIDYLKANSNTKIFVFGDMLELGINKEKMHNMIGDKLNEADVDYLFGFGEMAKYTINKFNNHGLWYEDINLLIKDLKKLMLEDNDITILVKGSRSMRMERVIEEIIK